MRSKEKSVKNFKCGSVVLLGEPNVGKSSLLNALVGERVSIVTDLAGTTREEVRGIVTGENFQIIFLDTPGMAKAKNNLDKFMGKSISHAVAKADTICYILDATDIKKEYIQKIINYQDKKPVIIAVNKTDKTNMQKLYPKLAELNKLEFVKAIIPCSSKTQSNLDVLSAEIVKNLPTAPAQFDTNDFTDQSVRKMCAEIIRGELIKHLHDEIPHGIAVHIVQFNEKNKEVEINANIICEKPSHKPIVIGEKGAVLKKVGVDARKELEVLTGKHVRLNTHVLTRENWKNRNDILDELGYRE